MELRFAPMSLAVLDGPFDHDDFIFECFSGDHFSGSRFRGRAFARCFPLHVRRVGYGSLCLASRLTVVKVVERALVGQVT